MRIEQARWTEDKGWSGKLDGLDGRARLVLVFGGVKALAARGPRAELRRRYPKALVFGCTTAGEILGTEVRDDTLTATAVAFDKTKVAGAHAKLVRPESSYAAGRKLAKALRKPGLAHVLVLSPGVDVNGSELVKGIVSGLPGGVAVTGGLAGDGGAFKRTLVLKGASAVHDEAAALGFYGKSLTVGCGSLGGWDSFGPERMITKSKGNVLYELDGRSALKLYKAYLGEHARGLPASGLLFPLTLRTEPEQAGVVRTVLGVAEGEKSMTFAGDVPEGSYVRLMRANFDRLIDGAASAATASKAGDKSPELAVLISCVGRKLVLGQRVEEEVEGVRDVLGRGAALTGFYSYGEISPFTQGARCELHNQTMTITTFRED